MKKHILILFTLFFTFNTLMQAQTELNFKLINNTGKDIYGVVLSEMNRDKFGDNILPKNVLKDRDTVSIKFSYVGGENICKWDLKLTHDKNEIKDEHSWIIVHEIDLCEIMFLTIYIEDGYYVFKVE
jgi:hypothetical protein